MVAMSTRAITVAELRAAALHGKFLVLTVGAFVVSIALVVLDWMDALPAGTGNAAALIMGAWVFAVILRAHRLRSRDQR